MRRFLLLTVTAGLLLLALTIGLASCDKTRAPTPDTSDTPAVTNQPTEEDTQVTDTDTTEEETEPTEVFKPDPQRAVPKYDALMSDLDTFPLTFTYGDTEYKGFAGFALESETYEELDRGVKSTLILRHPEIPAAFRLEATVYPKESAYEYVVYITNDGQENTAIFSDLAFEMEFVGDDPVISGIKGDAGGVNYTPYVQRNADQGFRKRIDAPSFFIGMGKHIDFQKLQGAAVCRVPLRHLRRKIHESQRIGFSGSSELERRGHTQKTAFDLINHSRFVFLIFHPLFNTFFYRYQFTPEYGKSKKRYGFFIQIMRRRRFAASRISSSINAFPSPGLPCSSAP